MPNVIEELYYGNISPDYGKSAPEPPLTEAKKLRSRNLVKLMERLNDEEKELFEKYCGAESDVEEILRYNAFRYALKFGVLLMAEVFVGMDEVTNYDD